MIALILSLTIAQILQAGETELTKEDHVPTSVDSVSDSLETPDTTGQDLPSLDQELTSGSLNASEIKKEENSPPETGVQYMPNLTNDLTNELKENNTANLTENTFVEIQSPQNKATNVLSSKDWVSAKELSENPIEEAADIMDDITKETAALAPPLNELSRQVNSFTYAAKDGYFWSGDRNKRPKAIHSKNELEKLIETTTKELEDKNLEFAKQKETIDGHRKFAAEKIKYNNDHLSTIKSNTSYRDYLTGSDQSLYYKDMTKKINKENSNLQAFIYYIDKTNHRESQAFQKAEKSVKTAITAAQAQIKATQKDILFKK